MDKRPKTLAEQLAERVGMHEVSRRQEIWLWLYLALRVRTDLPPESCGGITMREEILNALSDNPRFRSEVIRQEMDKQLLPDDRFSWITEDARQLRWLRHDLRHEVRGLPRELVQLTDLEHLIATLDTWDAHMVDKANLIERLRRDWTRHAARDSDFDWFRDRKTEAERCKCAWEWLEKQYLHPSHRRERIDSYQALLMFFDQEDLAREKQQDMVKKIKQRWNRQQLDVRNPDSKQVNVTLAAETINQLDRLARRNGLSRAKIVAKLIGKESELGLYLAE